MPARDAAAAQGALAVVAIVSARGAGPYLYGWLFDVLGKLGPVGILLIAARILRRGGAGGVRVAGRARRPRPPAERLDDPVRVRQQRETRRPALEAPPRVGARPVERLS